MRRTLWCRGEVNSHLRDSSGRALSLCIEDNGPCPSRAATRSRPSGCRVSASVAAQFAPTRLASRGRHDTDGAPSACALSARRLTDTSAPQAERNRTGIGCHGACTRCNEVAPPQTWSPRRDPARHSDRRRIDARNRLGQPDTAFSSGSAFQFEVRESCHLSNRTRDECVLVAMAGPLLAP